MAMRIVAVTWGAAIVYAGVLHSHRTTVHATSTMLDDCPAYTNATDRAPSTAVLAPASTVAAVSIVAVGVVSNVANAFAAAAAVTLALDNAYADPVVGNVAVGLLAALPGVVAIAAIADTGLGTSGSVASMALAAAAIFLAVDRSLYIVTVVLSLVPVVMLGVIRFEREDSVAASLLAAIAAAAARGAVNRDDGVCHDDLVAYRRRDYATGIAYVLGTIALTGLVEPQPPTANMAVLLSGALVLAWSVTNAEHWLGVSIAVAVLLCVGSIKVHRGPRPKKVAPPPPKPKAAPIYTPPVNWM